MATTSKPTFWKPGSARPGSALDRASEQEQAPLLPSTPSPSSASLPIAAQRRAILHALETHQVLVVVAETGSGKTTQIPQYLYSSGWASAGIIACTQPRRLAATSIASHVASSLSCKLGQEVGYTIRFEDNTSPSTRIKYLTDGALFRECLRDPLLTQYSVIMVDEAHERGMYTDLLLGVLRKILTKRRELRVIVASATLDALSIKDFFEESSLVGEPDFQERATVLQLKGRSFPVHTAYLTQPCTDYLEETVETIWKIHLAEPQGDILAFLTGREEVETALQLLSDRQSSLAPSAARMHLVPLFSGLSSPEQAAVFLPSPSVGMRKVVVATNIAEASITLDGIVYVVDCGYVKLRTADVDTGLESLCVVPISRASATQRAGRAGRTRAGKCFRLYTEPYFTHQMAASTPPELCRVALEGVVLMLKSLGVDNLVKFAWVAPAPPPQALARALQRLVELGALDSYGRLTQRGAWMGELPLPPHWSRILIAAAEPSGACADEMLAIVAMTQISSPFHSHSSSAETMLSMRQFAAQQGDLFTLLNVYLAFTDERIGRRSAKWCAKHRLNFQALSRALSIRTQLYHYLLRFSTRTLTPERSSDTVELDPKSTARTLPSDEAVQRITSCLIIGLYNNLARYNPTTMTYRIAVGDRDAYPHPTSVLFNRRPDHAKLWILFAEATQQPDRPQRAHSTSSTCTTTTTFIRDLTVLDSLDSVTTTVPGFYSVSTQWRQYDPTTQSALHTSRVQDESPAD